MFDHSHGIHLVSAAKIYRNGSLQLSLPIGRSLDMQIGWAVFYILPDPSGKGSMATQLPKTT